MPLGLYYAGAQPYAVGLIPTPWDKLAHILAFRSHLTVAEVKRKAYRFDWWLTAKEAVADGFADEILAAPVEVEGIKRSAVARAKAKGKTKDPGAPQRSQRRTTAATPPPRAAGRRFARGSRS